MTYDGQRTRKRTGTVNTYIYDVWREFLLTPSTERKGRRNQQSKWTWKNGHLDKGVLWKLHKNKQPIEDITIAKVIDHNSTYSRIQVAKTTKLGIWSANEAKERLIARFKAEPRGPQYKFPSCLPDACSNPQWEQCMYELGYNLGALPRVMKGICTVDLLVRSVQF